MPAEDKRYNPRKTYIDMHWADVIARELEQRGKEHVIATGTSISGLIHLGNAGDVIIGEVVQRALKHKGISARLIWIMDDGDALRSVPPQMPQTFKEYLGMPVNALPCPWECCASFVEHFTKPFLTSLEEIGVNPEPISNTELYKEADTIDT